jgi:hypothetical protein
MPANAINGPDVMNQSVDDADAAASKHTTSEGSESECSDSSEESSGDDDSDDDDDDSCSSYLSSDDEEFLKTEQLMVMSNMPSMVRKVSSFNDLQMEEMNATQVSVMLNQMRLTHARNEEFDDMDKSGRSLPKTLPSAQKTIPRSRFMHRASVTGISRTGTIVGMDMASEDGSRDEVTPTDVLKSILQEHGYEYRAIEASDLDDYFVGVTPDRVKCYSTDIISAIQTSDVKTLKKMHFEEKRNLDCCNKFGESVLHTACRRGLPDVVDFLINEAKVDLRVRDDYGRTPMHDACWTAEPNLPLIKFLVAEWPDLLFVADKRGFTPLQYVRNTHYATWCDFMNENKHLLLPKLLIKPLGDLSASPDGVIVNEISASTA